jgi:hypothetical protein
VRVLLAKRNKFMLQLKAFIYRFFAIFGLRIYLANKEEQAYINSLENLEDFLSGCERGLWQTRHGFTTVWTHRQPWYKALKVKIKHAFTFRSYE